MSELHICRICLNIAVKGDKLEEFKLRSSYEFILQEKLCPKDKLPQWVCYECVALLYKFHKFKEKCVNGLLILKKISLKENISYDSVTSVDRYKENLVSSLDIAKASENVQTVFIKYKPKIKSDSILITDIDSIASKEILKDDAFCDTDDTNFDTGNSNYDIDHTDHIDNSMSSDEEKRLDELTIKGEKLLTEKIIAKSMLTSADLVKSEILDIDEKNTDMNSLTNSNVHSYSTNACDIENITFDTDPNFDITDNVKSSDDESLMAIAKKRSKVKRKATKTDTKHKKPKTKNNKEVVLKNTIPSKLVLSPQFWKKINLTEEEALREFKQREFKNNYYLKANFKCNDCFKGFSKPEMLERHLKQKHDKNIGNLECRFCRVRFKLKHKLATHLKEHLIVYNCLHCKLQCTRLSTALTHQEHHKGTKKTCKHCGKEFNHLSTYYTHVRMSHRSAHVCVICGASFVSEHGLLLHTKFMHIDDLKQLEDKIRKRREDKNKGLTGIEPASDEAKDSEEIYCAKCDIQFMSRRAYNTHFFKSDNHDDGEHMASVPGPNSRSKIPTTCPLCNARFPTRVAYKKHHLAEHPETPLNIPKKRDICEVCGASVQMGSIQYHMKSHTGEREFACPAPQCELRFTLKRNMKRHYDVKHLGVVYPKYIRRNPPKRKKKSQDNLENDFSPFVRSRTGYFL